jgi:hypothetical protein
MASTLIRSVQNTIRPGKKEPPGSTHSPAAKFVNPAGQARRKLTTAVHPYMKTALARGFQEGLTAAAGATFKVSRKFFRAEMLLVRKSALVDGRAKTHRSGRDGT